MIAAAALAMIRAGVIVTCLPDRSGYIVALPEAGPGLACPLCGPEAAAMALCVVRQRLNGVGRLTDGYHCLRCLELEVAA